MTHKCSSCGKTFETKEEYLNHPCDKANGAKPGTPEFLKATTLKNYDSVSASALKRGAEKLTK